MKIPQELEPYLQHLNNTGGNIPQDLIDRLERDNNLSQTNLFVFVMAACVQSQVDLLATLKKEGLLLEKPL